MGGLAIGTLTGAHIHRLVLGASAWLVHGVRTLTVVTWAAATVWLPVLVYAAIRRMRHQRGASPHPWWATVFPLGMYFRGDALARNADRLAAVEHDIGGVLRGSADGMVDCHRRRDSGRGPALAHHLRVAAVTSHSSPVRGNNMTVAS